MPHQKNGTVVILEPTLDMAAIRHKRLVLGHDKWKFRYQDRIIVTTMKTTMAQDHGSRNWLRCIALISLLLGMALSIVPGTFAQDQPTVRILEIDGTITPALATYIERGINSANNDGVAAIILEIDTPGGLSSAMDDIIRSILESETPVVAWVSPMGGRAASAGVYITYASHIAAMAPGTNIGSASPVSMGGGGEDNETTETMNRKVTNDAVAQIRNLANLRDRNADWAEDAVRDAVNITADQALELNVIDLIAGDLETLLTEIDGQVVMLADGTETALTTAGASASTTSMNLIERVLQVVSDPTIAFLMLSIGSLGIFLELSNPGALIPGIVGVLSLILGLYALGTIPVNWTGVALILFAFALFFIDLFVTSFGILLIGGLTAFIVGSYMLIDTSIPGFGAVSRPVIWGSAALIVATALFIGTAVLRARLSKPTTGRQAMIGAIGTVRTPLDPHGKVFLMGELWTATADNASSDHPVEAGSKVRVTELHGLRLLVQTAPATAPETSASERNRSVIPVDDGVRTIPPEPTR